MKRSMFAGLTCVVALHGGAAAQAQSSDALAQEIAEIAYKPEDAETAFVESYVKSFGDGLAKNPQFAALLNRRPDVRGIVLTTARQAAGEQYAAVVQPALIRSVANVYATNFSSAELLELQTYYQTPEAQRLLRSFSSTGATAEVAAAQSDQVVVRFLSSPTGQKERQLSGALAKAMTNGMIGTAQKVNDAVLPKVQQAVRAAMARPGRSK